MRTWILLLALTLAGCIRGVADIPTEEGGFIRGTVVARSAATGLYEAVVGARVEIAGSSVGRTTDAMGMFELNRLPLETYRLDIALRAAGGAPPRAVRQTVRLLADGQSVDLGPVRLGDNAQLRGSVRIADDEADGAAQGTLVVLVATPFVAVVGADGTYAFREVPPGPYQLVAYRPGYARGGHDDVVLQPSVKVELSEIVLGAAEAPSQIEVKGRVDVVGANDDGVMVAFIDETTTAVPNRYEATPTDTEGVFTANVPEGLYRVRFTRSDLRPAELRNVVVTAEGAAGLDPVFLGVAAPGDADGDGVADTIDDDDDDDGCLDGPDEYETDPLFCFDSDGDGIPDEEDPNNDRDALLDVEENSPGEDGWVTLPFDAFTDNDAFDDAEDNCPTVDNPDQADTDDDGIGDACDEGTSTSTTTPIGVPATVTSMMPTTAPVGALVTIDGTNFVADRAQTFVSFAGGLTPVDQVTATRIAVRVPPEAQSGVVRVYSGPYVVTATSSFVLVPPPVVRSFSPTSARPGQLVAVFGDRFDAPDTVVMVAGRATDPATCPVEVTTEATARGLDVLCIRPAPGTLSGRVTVSSSYGAGTSVAALTVLEGPQIVRFSINPVAPGGQTTIIGSGFALDGLVGAIEVDLVNATEIAPVSSTDTSITIEVPSGAATGTVTVHHPSGDVTSQAVLQVTNGAPGIVDFGPNPAMEGDTLVITGFDLDQTSEIEFANGVRATPTSIQPTELRVMVPTGVAPGPITAIAPTANGVSSRRLAVMTMIENVPYPGQNYVSGIALTTGDAVVAIGIDATLRQFDSQTLAPIGQPTPTSLVTASRLLGTARPNRALVWTPSVNPNTILIIDLPSGAVLTSCPWTGLPPPTLVQDVTGRYAFFAPGQGTDGVMRVDLDAHTCDFIGVRPGVDLGGVGLVGNELLVRDRGNPSAFALMNVDPFDLVPDGTYTSDFGTLNTAVSYSSHFMQYLGTPTLVFSSVGSGGLFVESIAGTSPLRVMGGGPRDTLAQSTNTRWSISDFNSVGTFLIDLQLQRVARALPAARTQTVVALRQPAAFIIRVGGTLDVFARVEIRE